MIGALRFRKLARAARLLALLCFLLPFATISCSSRELTDAFNNAMGDSASPVPVPAGAPGRCTLIRATGVQLAVGSAQLSGECVQAVSAFLPASGPASLAGTSFARPDPAVILAALLILLAAASGVLLSARPAAIVGVAGDALAIFVLILAVFVRLPRALHDLPRPQSLPVAEPQLARILEVGGGVGLWLAILLLLVAIAFEILAAKGRRAPAPGENAL